MIQTINPQSIAATFSAYSHGAIIPPGTGLVVTSGTIGVDLDGYVPPDFDAQCRLVWSNIAVILAEAGCGLNDIVRINGFLKRREDSGMFRDIRNEVISHAPASTIVIAELIDPAWLIEVEVMAMRVYPASGMDFAEGSR